MKGIWAVLLTIAVIFLLAPVSLASEIDFASLEAGELERATAWGLVPEEWDGQIEQDITYAEFCTLARTLVERLKPEGLSQWDQYAEQAALSDQVMDRFDGAYGMLYAAIVLDCPETSWDYAEIRKLEAHPGFVDFDPQPDVWPQMSSDFQIRCSVPRTPQGTDGSHDAGDTPALWFVILRLSPYNELPLMSWDEEYDMRWRDNLTRREAIVYLWRLVEGEANLLSGNHYIHADEVGSYDRSIITDELLNKNSALPDVTHSQLPSTWSGFGYTHYKDASIHREYREGELELYAENGFNFARVFLGFASLRYPDYPSDVFLMNETELLELDQLIAWGMEHDVHIQLSMGDTPSRYETFEGMPEEEWDYLRAYWWALARRYQGIPSRYLTFDLANELQPFYDQVDWGLAHMEKLVQGIREIDPDRVLLISYGGFPWPDWLEGTAALGLSLGIHAYAPTTLASGDSEYAYPMQKTVPYPFFPAMLCMGEKLVIEGDLGGNLLWLDMWSSGPIRITYDSGEEFVFEPIAEEPGARATEPGTVFIPEGVTRLVMEPLLYDVRFWEMGIQLVDENGEAVPSLGHYLVPHDVWVEEKRGGAHLYWDAESGFSSDRCITGEYVYEELLLPKIEVAKKHGVGYMVNETGSYAEGWDVSVKLDMDRDVCSMLKEREISWAICEFATLSLLYPGQGPIWQNATWESKTYTYEDGTRHTITYSSELMQMYRECIAP